MKTSIQQFKEADQMLLAWESLKLDHEIKKLTTSYFAATLTIQHIINHANFMMLDETQTVELIARYKLFLCTN